PEGQRAFVMLLTNSVLHYTELEFTGLFAHGFAYLLQDGIKPTTRDGVIAQHIAQDNAAAGWVGCEPVLAAIDAAIRVLIPLSRAESRDFYSEQMESARVTYRRLIGDWPEAVCAENQFFFGTDATLPTAHTRDF